MAGDSQVRKRKDFQTKDVVTGASSSPDLKSKSEDVSRSVGSLVVVILAAILCVSVFTGLVYIELFASKAAPSKYRAAVNTGQAAVGGDALPQANTVWQLEGSEPEPAIIQQQQQPGAGGQQMAQKRVRVRQVVKVHKYADGRVEEEVVSEEVIEGASEEELDSGPVVQDADPELLEKIGDFAGASRLREEKKASAATQQQVVGGSGQEVVRGSGQEVVAGSAETVLQNSEPAMMPGQTVVAGVLKDSVVEESKQNADPVTSGTAGKREKIREGHVEATKSPSKSVDKEKSSNSNGPSGSETLSDKKSADNAPTKQSPSKPQSSNSKTKDKISAQTNKKSDDKKSGEKPEVKKPTTSPGVSNNAAKKNTASGVKQPSDVERKSSSKTSVIKEETLDAADLLEQADGLVDKDVAAALSIYNTILSQHDQSVNALWGRARCLSLISVQLSSRSHREKAVSTFLQLLDLPLSDALFKSAIKACVNDLKLLGHYERAIRVQQRGVQRMASDVELRNHLAVLFMTINQNSPAQEVLTETLRLWPENSFAKVHLGFIRKQQGRLSEAVELLESGLKSDDDGDDVHDAKFYHFLGDALLRLGFQQRSDQVYRAAVARGLFPSFYQRSLYNVEGLRASPVWTIQESGAVSLIRDLESQWLDIRQELTSLMTSERPEDGFRPESEHLTRSGNWRQYTLFSRGRKHQYECVKTPATCGIISQHPVAASCRRCQVKFSLIDAGSQVWPHAGPTNCRLRAHLTLIASENAFIKIANITRSWRDGEVMVFDDSFVHEVWHNGNGVRAVLIVDFWHPDLNETMRKTLPSI